MQRININVEREVVVARQAARELAKDMGFSLVDKTRIATAVSELARNVLVHGGGGHVEISQVSDAGREGLHFMFVDQGPGIPDIEEALRDGFSTGRGLGHGLPGSRRLMDELTIVSDVGGGTRVETTKWLAGK